MRYAFTSAIRPGQTEAVPQFINELKGPCREEYEDMQRRTGVTEEAYWLQQSPKRGDSFIMTSNSDQREFVELMEAPQTEFDRWFGDRIGELFELELDPDTPTPELLMDWRAPS